MHRLPSVTAFFPSCAPKLAAAAAPQRHRLPHNLQQQQQRTASAFVVSTSRASHSTRLLRHPLRHIGIQIRSANSFPRSVASASPSFSLSRGLSMSAAVEGHAGAAPVPQQRLRRLNELLPLASQFTEALPGATPHDPRRPQPNLPKAIYALVEPTPLLGEDKLRLVSFSKDVCERVLDLDPSEADTEDFLLYFAGNRTLPVGRGPWAHRYGGHQFGYWANQLGDGRAISLGEVVNSRSERWELQLKGAGLTPFSRFADGRAVLRSSIREFLASEHMHALGIPTSRALSLIHAPKQPVQREIVETAAVVCRIAPSWLRLGSFQILAANEEVSELRMLADYAFEKVLHLHSTDNVNEINAKSYSPDQQKAERSDDDKADANQNVADSSTSNQAGTAQPNAASDAKYLRLFEEVVRRNAELVAHWQAVGFVHTVLNTDNVSIIGITIDYGPFGFMNEFDPSWIPNHSDEMGRYTLKNQPAVMLWNMYRFAEAISPLLTDPATNDLLTILKKYETFFGGKFNDLMRLKLGLPDLQPTDANDLLMPILQIASAAKVDWTNFWRSLSQEDVQRAVAEGDEVPIAIFEKYPDLVVASKESSFAPWWKKYSERVKALSSSSSSESSDAVVEHVQRMKAVNPKFVLRNHLAEKAIYSAETGDYTEVNSLLRVMTRPFDEGESSDARYTKPPPEEMRLFQCSCSS